MLVPNRRDEGCDGRLSDRERRETGRLHRRCRNPQAPTHVVIIPKGEYVSVDDFSAKASAAELAAFLRAVPKIAAAENVVESGYRILANHGEAAHQEVPHFHLHIFGGRDLGPMLRRPRE